MTTIDKPLPHFTQKLAPPQPPADVPCGKCRLCCKTTFVFLREDEYQRYHWGWCNREKDGKLVTIGRVLQRRKDGSCVYLDEEKGCTIHEWAPATCRSFDCRELFLRSDRSGRRHAVKNGIVKQEMYDQGRKMAMKLVPEADK